MISIIFLVFAFVLACLAAWRTIPPADPWGSRLGWAALACYFLSLLLGSSGFGAHWR